VAVLGLLMMTMKVTKETEIKLTVNIKPVKLAELTPVQRQSWVHLWRRMVSQVTDELKDE